jgi:hypothetical protein
MTATTMTFVSYAVPDPHPTPADATAGDPFSLVFKQPVRRAVPWAVGAVVLVALTAVELSVGTGLRAGPPLVIGAVMTGVMAVVRGVLATRPAVVVGRGGVWFCRSGDQPPALMPWTHVSELVFFRATDPTGGDRHSRTTGAALGARRSPAEVLPTEAEDGFAQLGALLQNAPHTEDLLRSAVSVPFSLPHRFVRSNALMRREELARAVAGWAPEVGVVLGPPVDFRARGLLGPVLRDGLQGVRNRLRDEH